MGNNLFDESTKEEFTKELLKMKKSLVKVYLLDGRVLMGKLINIDPDYLNIFIEELTKDEQEQEITLIPGSSISHIKMIKTKKKKRRPIEEKVLKLLEREPTLTEEQIAQILDIDPTKIKKAVKKLKRKATTNI